jgi:ribosomal protein S12 methylthiotransferase accessory factor
MTRALLEAAQTRLALISGAREDIVDRHYERRGATPRTDTFRPSRPHAVTRPGLDGALATLEAAEVESVLAVDLSPSHLPISVVRVVVPGLEGMPFSRRYSPGPRAVRILGAAR